MDEAKKKIGEKYTKAEAKCNKLVKILEAISKIKLTKLGNSRMNSSVELINQ